MFNSISHNPSVLKIAVVATFMAALAVSPLAVAQEHEHPSSVAAATAASGKEKLDAAASKEVTGEVVDLMCYVDHKAMGDKHSACGTKCIKGGGPVGIVADGKAYLVVGEHKPINDQLADSCGKTITLKGKVAERDGLAMLANAEIVKK
jgi:hypothetical protein